MQRKKLFAKPTITRTHLMRRLSHGTLSGAALGGPRASRRPPSGPATARLDREDPVDVVEAPGHDACGGVGQLKGVAQLVQGCTQPRRVIGPVELTAHTEPEIKFTTFFLKHIKL